MSSLFLMITGIVGGGGGGGGGGEEKHLRACSVAMSIEDVWWLDRCQLSFFLAFENGCQMWFLVAIHLSSAMV